MRSMVLKDFVSLVDQLSASSSMDHSLTPHANGDVNGARHGDVHTNDSNASTEENTNGQTITVQLSTQGGVSRGSSQRSVV